MIPLSRTILGFAALGLFLSFAQPAAAQFWHKRTDDAVSTVEATGEGRVEVSATLAQATVAVVGREKTAEALNNALAKRAESLLAFLNGDKAANVQTEAIQISPHYDLVQGVQQQNGFDGRIAVHFESSIKDTGELLSGSLRSGASESGGFTPKVDQSDLQKAREVAITEAVGDALTKARIALGAAGLAERRICKITANSDGGNDMLRGFAEAAAPARTLPVQAGTHEVTATVSVVLEFAPR